MLDHISGNAGVFPDDNPRLVTFAFEDVGGCNPDPQGNFGRHGIFICHTTYPVCPEKFAHDYAVPCVDQLDVSYTLFREILQ